MSSYDPPRALVTDGLYRFVRNPMYVGVLLAVLGLALWWWSRSVLIYAVGVAIAFHLRVLIYEEPRLTQSFASDFAQYRARVPRWLPRWLPRLGKGRGRKHNLENTNGEREIVVTTHATGTFEVKLQPLTAYDAAEGSPLGRMSIDKQFQGDLEGTSKGEMLTGMTSVKNSAGYVAIERVTGALNGRSGTFIFQHSGTMTRGAPTLVVTVVPDSGTGELLGLAGAMAINIEDGKHLYELDYTLPDSH